MGPWDKDEFDIKVKIADFGLAKFIGELKFTNTLCGTPAYVAPEILKPNCRKYSTKSIFGHWGYYYTYVFVGSRHLVMNWVHQI